MGEMLELSDKDFKVAIIKIRQGTIMNTLEIDEKKKYIKSQQRHGRHREEPNGNFRTEKYDN